MNIGSYIYKFCLCANQYKWNFTPLKYFVNSVNYNLLDLSSKVFSFKPCMGKNHYFVLQLSLFSIPRVYLLQVFFLYLSKLLVSLTKKTKAAAFLKCLLASLNLAELNIFFFTNFYFFYILYFIIQSLYSSLCQSVIICFEKLPQIFNSLFAYRLPKFLRYVKFRWFP